MSREFNKRVRLDLRGRARLATIAAVAVVALVAASCGDSDSSADPIEDATTTAAEQPQETLELDVEPDDTVEETAGSVAQEAEPASEAGQEFIELAYFEGFLPTGVSLTQETGEECDNSDPAVVVCDYESTGEMTATHIGAASETQTGTLTTYLTESCTSLNGTTGNRVVSRGTGIITTAWGDELHFIIGSDSCSRAISTGYWEVVGGTGRFEDASGIMSTMSPGAYSEFLVFNVGTLKVRADLWESILPPFD